MRQFDSKICVDVWRHQNVSEASSVTRPDCLARWLHAARAASMSVHFRSVRGRFPSGATRSWQSNPVTCPARVCKCVPRAVRTTRLRGRNLKQQVVSETRKSFAGWLATGPRLLAMLQLAAMMSGHGPALAWVIFLRDSGAARSRLTGGS